MDSIKKKRKESERLCRHSRCSSQTAFSWVRVRVRVRVRVPKNLYAYEHHGKPMHASVSVPRRHSAYSIVRRRKNSREVTYEYSTMGGNSRNAVVLLYCSSEWFVRELQY